MTEPLAPDYAVDVDPTQRLVRFRMAGIMTVTAMADVLALAKDAMRALGSGPHVVLADMRGLRTMSKEVANVFGQVVHYTRTHGTALCAHVSDLTIQRLQAARVARHASPDDDVTVDCNSIEEAELVCRQASVHLGAGRNENLVSRLIDQAEHAAESPRAAG